MHKFQSPSTTTPCPGARKVLLEGRPHAVVVSARTESRIDFLDRPVGSAHIAASPAEDAFVADERFGKTDKMWISRKGKSEPERLCRITDWFEERDGVLQPTRHPPYPRLLPNGLGVTLTNGGDVYPAEE